MSNEKSWNTSAPAGYNDTHVQTLWQAQPIYPSKDSHSEILPYDQREHAYNGDQYDMSNEKSWNTSAPAGYNDTHVQTLWQAQPIYPSKDSHSEILPYDQREHAYNGDQYDMSNEKSWNTSAPAGYNDTHAFLQTRSK